MLASLAEKQRDEQDFYEILGLLRYCEMDSAGLDKMNAEFRRLILEWHPDKNPAEKKEECEAWSCKLCLAKHVLSDTDLKRRYDVELRKQRGEEDGWSTVRWWVRWGYCVVAMAGGLSLIITGSIAGSVLLTSGLKGAIQMCTDPDCSDTEFVKDVAVGALQGAAGGACGAAASAAMAGANVAAQLGLAAVGGAGAVVSGQVISDATDIAITEGMLGQAVKDNVSSAKTTAEVFCVDNAKRLATGAFIGATAGVVVHGVVCLAGATGAAGSVGGASDNIVDDAAVVASSSQRVTAGAGTAAKTIAKGAAKVAIAGGKQAAKVAIAGGALKAWQTSTDQAALAVGCAANLSLVNDGVPSLAERIRKLKPEVAHRLVEDASEADFMLSRTNLQREFADDKVVSLLEDGFCLCADNSLKGGWGGAGWVKKYVRDAQETNFGILVLEGGEGFFESTPCCDELYAAKQAGVNLTKLNGRSIREGEYLWVEIDDELFDSREAFEESKRQKLGNRFTPIHYRATLGRYHDSSLEGRQYTYYCVVPQGRAARATRADQQRF